MKKITLFLFLLLTLSHFSQSNNINNINSVNNINNVNKANSNANNNANNNIKSSFLEVDQDNLFVAQNLIKQLNAMNSKTNGYKECYEASWNPFVESADKIEFSIDPKSGKRRISSKVILSQAFTQREVPSHLGNIRHGDARGHLSGDSIVPVSRPTIWHEESGEIFKDPSFSEIIDNQMHANFLVEPDVIGSFEVTFRAYNYNPTTREKEEMLCIDIPFKITEKDLENSNTNNN